MQCSNSFSLLYSLFVPFSSLLLNATTLFSWKWRSFSPDGYWKPQQRLKASFHSDYIALLYCFIKAGSLLSSWVIEEVLSKSKLPLPVSSFCQLTKNTFKQKLPVGRGGWARGSAKHPPDFKCRHFLCQIVFLLFILSWCITPISE